MNFAFLRAGCVNSLPQTVVGAFQEMLNAFMCRMTCCACRQKLHQVLAAFRQSSCAHASPMSCQSQTLSAFGPSRLT